MTHNNPDTASSPLARQAQWLESYRPALRVSERGSVVSVGDGIAWIAGLPSAAMDDLLVFEDGSRAMVFDLTEEGVIIASNERENLKVLKPEVELLGQSWWKVGEPDFTP